HSCAVREDGSVTCWGAGAAGASGFPNFAQSAAPAGSFSQVAAGEAHSCAITAEGWVSCWGSDGAGRATPPLGFAATEEFAEHQQAAQAQDEQSVDGQ